MKMQIMPYLGCSTAAMIHHHFFICFFSFPGEISIKREGEESGGAELHLPEEIYGSFYPNVKCPSTGKEY